jgi:ubiquinone/menaquinone biosynthesis C-methylase UbiE
MQMNWAESLYVDSSLRRRRIRRDVVPALLELGGALNEAHALDVGCGPGECVACEIEMMGAASVHAVDLDPKMVKRASRRLSQFGDKVKIAVGDVTDLAFDDATFGAVFNFAALHHVPDWRRALGEIARVLTPGGSCYSQDHDVEHHDWLSKRLFRHPPDRFTNVEFLATLAQRGLAVGDRVLDRPAQLLVVAKKEPGSAN